MKIAIASRKMELTEGMKEHIETKLAKLDKFFGDDAEAKVTFTVEKDSHKVETTIHSHGSIIRVEESTGDLYRTMDKIIDSLERKIRKHKTKLERRIKSVSIDALFPADEENDVEEEHEFNIVKRKMFTTKPMSAEEAILEMNLVGHEFFVFKNDRTFGTNIVYKRKDGNYSLIEIS
jgi:putative sigma-54 modulation protein